MKGELLLDLPYAEDSLADVDMNVVATGADGSSRCRGPASTRTFSRDELARLTELALRGTAELARLQSRAVAEATR